MTRPAESVPHRRTPLLDPLLLAIGTLTALAVPAPSTVDRTTARRAMLLAPVAALFPGGAAAGTAALTVDAGLSPLVAAALAVGAAIVASRGLHLDGLSDTADGLAASYDRERALDVMRRGDSGPAGVTALVLVLMLQIVALAQCLVGPLGALSPLVAIVVSRTALPLVCAAGIPAARPGGLGATVAGTVPPAAAGLTVLAVTLATTGLALGAGEPWWRGPAAVAAAVLAAGALTWRAVRRLGGITGDVLGACVEVATVAALLLLAI